MSLKALLKTEKQGALQTSSVASSKVGDGHREGLSPTSWEKKGTTMKLPRLVSRQTGWFNPLMIETNVPVT